MCVGRSLQGRLELLNQGVPWQYQLGVGRFSEEGVQGTLQLFQLLRELSGRCNASLDEELRLVVPESRELLGWSEWNDVVMKMLHEKLPSSPTVEFIQTCCCLCVSAPFPGS